MNDLFGIVVIGRNEGERLVRCLRSALAIAPKVVYADSGSTDGSAAQARELGVPVVELDPSLPFSAARARNEGFEALLRRWPSIELVQFVDGDCEVVAGWVERGIAELSAHADYGIVAGHTVERCPDATIYNRLCALEWQKPPGDIQACGGIFMVRAAIYRDVGGMNPRIIAAEDDELCLRVRRRGFRIVQVNSDMVLHDAAITRFSQWWTRSLRAGYAFAQGAFLHGRSSEGHFVHEARRTWFWAVGVPVTALALCPVTSGGSLVLLLGFPASAYKIYRYGQSRGWSPVESLLYAGACVLGKFPNALGMARFHLDRIRGRHGTIIEYKSAT